jgi:hypothetical protein
LWSAIVNEERLERREEQAGGVTDARDGLSGGADSAAQFLQHKFVAGGFVATQHAALELSHEHRPRLRLERAQIVPQAFDRLAVAGHCHTTSPGRRRVPSSRRAIKKALRKMSGIQGDRARRDEP